MTVDHFLPTGFVLAYVAAVAVVLALVQACAFVAVRRRRRARARSARMTRRIVSSYGSNPSGREPQARQAIPLAASVSEAAAAGESPSRPEFPYPQSPLASRRA